MDAFRGRQDGREKSHVSIWGRIDLTRLLRFGVGDVVQQYIRIVTAQLLIASHVTPACHTAVTREFMRLCHIDHRVAFACKVEVADLQVSLFAVAARSPMIADGDEVPALANVDVGVGVGVGVRDCSS